MQRTSLNSPRGHRVRIATFAIAFLAATYLPIAAAESGNGGTLDRVRQSGKITLGYRTDARPITFKDESGSATGYAVAMCQKIAEQVKTELGLSKLAVNWVPVTMESGPRDVQQGKVDLLCGDIDTLAKRKEISFSVPIFPAGLGAVLRADSSVQLQEVLSTGTVKTRPVWRAAPARTLENRTFSVVANSLTASWVNERLTTFQINAKVAPVDSYEAGIRSVLDRSSDVFFAERSILMDSARRSQAGTELIVLDRRFTYMPLGIGLRRGDEDLRLFVDRTLSRLYRSAEFAEIFAKWFGKPDEATLNFFRVSALPE